MKPILLQFTFALYSLLVIVLTLMPSDGPDVGFLDKVFHFIMYFLMAVLALMAFRSKRERLIALIYTFGIGLVLEWGQGFVDQRSPSIADGLANILGAFTGTILYLAWQRMAKASWKEEVGSE